MATITISLNQGDNYISFPASSADNFGTILTSSTIKDKITKFIKYHPILGEIPIIDSDYIERGIGYYLYITISGNIIYNSTGNYDISIDEFKSRVLKGWNLLATGSKTIVLPQWCNITDADTGTPSTILEPMKAYWVNYDNCIKPALTTTVIAIMGSIGTILFTYSMLRQYKIIGNEKKEDKKQSKEED